MLSNWYNLATWYYFQITLIQACTCLAFAPSKQDSTSRTTVSNIEEAPVIAHQILENHSLPPIAAGYSDGTVRMFDIDKVEMVLKMHPHAVSVTAINFSSDGETVDNNV